MMILAEGCSWVDVVCQANESVNNMLLDFADTLAKWYAGLISGSLNSDSSMKIFATENQTGAFANIGLQNQFMFWLSIMISVLIIVSLVQLSIAIIAADSKRIIGVVIGLVCAIPVTFFSLSMMQLSMRAVDEITDSFVALMLDDKEGGLSAAILSLTGMGHLASDSFTISDAAFLVLMPAGSAIWYLLLFGLLVLGALFLSIAMIVRTFGLAVLATVMPIGLLFIGQKKLGSWSIKWLEFTVALLLAKPLSAAIIGVSVALAAGGATGEQIQSGETVTDFWGVIAAFVALMLATMSPAIMLRFVRFASNDMQTAYGNRASITSAIGKVAVMKGVTSSVTRSANSLLSRGRSGSNGSSSATGKGPGSGLSGAGTGATGKGPKNASADASAKAPHLKGKKPAPSPKSGQQNTQGSSSNPPSQKSGAGQNLSSKRRKPVTPQQTRSKTTTTSQTQKRLLETQRERTRR